MINKKAILPFIFFLLMIISSCKDKETEKKPEWNKNIRSFREMFDIFNKEYEIKSKIFIDDSINYSTIFDIDIFDENLLIREIGNTPYIFKVYDLKTGKFKNNFVRRGKGPNEFLDIYPFEYTKDSMIALETYRDKLYVFSKDKLKDKNATYNREIPIKVKERGDFIWGIYPIYDFFITNGILGKGAYCTYTKDGIAKYVFGEYPKVKSHLIVDNRQRGYRFSAETKFSFNYNINRLVSSTRHSIDFFDYDKKKDTFSLYFHAQWAYEDIATVEYTSKGLPMAISIATDEDTRGLGKIVTTDKYVIFSFSEYSRKEESKKEIVENHYSYLFVTDWNANPICRLKLDRPIYWPLQISEDQKTIYAKHVDMETGLEQVITYDISNIDKLIKE